MRVFCCAIQIPGGTESLDCRPWTHSREEEGLGLTWSKDWGRKEANEEASRDVERVRAALAK